LKSKSILQFSFADNSTDGIASPGDNVMLVAYAPNLQQASLNVIAFKGHAVETWIGFLSQDEKDARTVCIRTNSRARLNNE
jgi:hypothetical protein